MSRVESPTRTTLSAADRVDLGQLAIERGAPSAARGISVRRPWLTRYVLPGGIVIGFVALFVWAARESLFPAHRVTVAPVVVTRAEEQVEGTPLFQAAGWIEPSPTPTLVTALAPGVVEELFVVEGERVELGQPLARLNEVDAELEVKRAEAAVRLCGADVQSAQADLTAAQTRLAHPNELRAALADADSLLAETRLKLGNLPYLIDAARSRLDVARVNVDLKERAGDAVAGRLLREAKAEVAAATSLLGELEAREPQLQQQAEALERKRAALAEQLRLMTDEKQAVSAAEAALAAAEARRDQARLTLDAARLALDRMTIRAPIDGRVLTLEARPGTRLAGMDPSSERSASAVVTLYDPRQLQVRTDVRLEDVPQVVIGQPATIETAALDAPIRGTVSWITTRADIQKNTLQVKVLLSDPPDVITPEMLGRVTFLAPPQEKPTAGVTPALRLLVPRELVIAGELGDALWIVDPLSTVARLQSVELGRAGTDQLVVITSGLDPTTKLIVAGREGLADGDRISIAEATSSPTLSARP